MLDHYARLVAQRGTSLAFTLRQMPEEADPRDRPKTWKESWIARFFNAKNTIWSWLTDPAVLLYRREASGRRKARILIVEFFLFLREITREFYQIEGTSRAASLAYTTLLSLIPLLVAFTTTLRNMFSNLFPNFES